MINELYSYMCWNKTGNIGLYMYTVTDSIINKRRNLVSAYTIINRIVLYKHTRFTIFTTKYDKH